MSRSPLDWMFSSEFPLPSGLELAVLANATAELGQARLEELGELVGPQALPQLVNQTGPYELADELVEELGLEGVRLGEGGEFPALTPARWRGPECGAETWDSLRARLRESNGSVVGLCLDRAQRASFLEFLTRNRVSVDGEADPLEIVGLARHFFFDEPLNVVVRYTGPRFLHA